MSTSLIQHFFKIPEVAQENPIQQQSSFFRHPLQATDEAIHGRINSVEKKIKEVFIHNAPVLTHQIESIVSNALLKTPPAEIVELKTLLSKLLPDSQMLPLPKDLSRICELLDALNEDSLKKLTENITNAQGEKLELKEEGTHFILGLQGDIIRGITLIGDEEGDGRYELTRDLQEKVKDACAIFDLCIVSNQGSMIKVANFAKEALIDPLMDRVEHLPNTLLNNAFKSGNEPQKRMGTSEPGSFVSYLKIAADTFEYFAGILGKTLLQKGVEKFSLAFLVGLEEGKKYAENKPEYRHTFEALEKIIAEVKKIAYSATPEDLQGANLYHLSQTIRQTLKVINAHQLYFNGFIKLPRLGGTDEIETNSLGLIGNNLKKMKDDTTELTTERRDYAFHIEIEKKAFIQNTANFATLNCVYGSKFLCGMHPKDDFYYELLEEARNGDSPRALRRAFFEKIDQAHAAGEISFFRKILSKTAYRVISPVMLFFVDRFGARVIGCLHENMEQHFKSVVDGSIENMTRYLAVLGNSFRRVAYQTENVDAIPKMIERDLERPGSNCDYTLDQLYKSFTKKVIDRFSPRLEWTFLFKRWIDKYKFDSSAPFKRGFNFVLDCLSIPSLFLLWIPEKVVNYLVSSIVKRILVHNEIVKTMVDKCSSSAIDQNGYMHALNSVLNDQLEKILNLMKEALSEKKAHSKEILTDKESEDKKEHFTALIKNLFEVLGKSKCASQNELREVFENKPLSERIEDLTIGNAVKTAMELIKIAIDSVLEKDQMNKRMLEFMSLVNQTYQVGAKITPEKSKAVETQIKDKCDKIIHAAIDMALYDYFDPNLSKLKADSHRFIEELKDSTLVFINSSSSLVREIQSLTPAGNQNANVLLQKMKELSIKFQQTRLNSQFLAKVNENFDSETKKRLDDLTSQLAKQFSTMDHELRQVIKIQNDNTAREEIIKSLSEIENAFGRIEKQTPLASFDEIDKVEKIASGLQHLNVLTNTLVPQILEQTKQTREVLTNRKSSKLILESIASSQANLPHLMNAFKEEKIKEISKTAKANQSKKIYSQLAEKIQNIPNKNLQEKFLQSLILIKNASSLGELDRFCKEWQTLYQQVFEHQNQRILILQEKIKTIHLSMVRSIEGSGEKNPVFIKDNLEKMHAHLQIYLNRLKQLEQWSQELNDIPILNIVISDLTQFRDSAKVLATEQVKKKVDALIAFMRKRYNIPGLIHHLIMLPFIDKSNNRLASTQRR